MRRYTTHEEVRQARLPPNVTAALEWTLAGELQLAGPDGYDPDSTGSIWLVEETDTDATIAEHLGRPLAELLFEHVEHIPKRELFLAYLGRNNSRCDALVIPDADWLPEAWAVALLAQI